MPTPTQLEALRSLPQVEELLHHPAVEALSAVLPRELVVGFAREAVDAARQDILAGQIPDCSPDALASWALRRALKLERPSLRRVVNASGVIIHTNLGRSVLAEPAVEAVVEVARGYSTLEYDCAAMARGSRHAHYEQMICALTGAEAAIAVNNNAAAVMMTLAEFAGGCEAIISRGELVEIGGSFRVPDIMALSDARMVEVGTTNKTHLYDYERAINDGTAMLLKVHPSNFRLTGFTESVGVKELRKLADAVNSERSGAGVGGRAAGHAAPATHAVRKVLVYEDLGSGALVDVASGSFHETTVRQALGEGADLVSFSCDKLMGGPQAGIIVGKRDYVDRLKASPYARVLRLDKMTIAALEATLRLYLDEDLARSSIPTVRMLTETDEQVLERTRAVAEALRSAIPAGCASVNVEQDISRAGGGALPMCDIPTYVARVSFERGCAQDCGRHLISERDVPVIARINGDCILVDGRTVLGADEVDEIARGFSEYFESLEA